MTNEQIIFNQRCRLMEEGLIGTTGKTVEMIDAEGNPVLMQEPEEIHTFHTWKNLGYTVKKGEHAIATFDIWKHKIQKAKEEEKEDQEVMFMTKAFFFAASQVKPLDEVSEREGGDAA